MRRLIPLALSKCNVAAECENNWFERTTVDLFGLIPTDHILAKISELGPSESPIGGTSHLY